MISRCCKRNSIIKIHVPSEGFTRENCLAAFYKGKLIRKNVSPSVNLNRLNTFILIKNSDLLFMNHDKQEFLTSLNNYNKSTLSFINFIDSLDFSKNLVLVEGYSNESISLIKELQHNITKHCDINNIKYNIYVRNHPRHTNVVQYVVSNDDIVIACNSTQFVLNRYLENRSTFNFHVCKNQGLVFDPSPHTEIPLVIL